MITSLIEQENLGTSWGILLTYNTPYEREQAIDDLEDEFRAIRRHIIEEDIDDISLGKGAVNCVDISGCSSIFSSSSGVGQELMGWIKSRRIVLLCKEWEWELLQTRSRRWTSHLDRVESVSGLEMAPAEAVTSLLEEKQISRLPQRLAVYEYLQCRSLFTRFLQEIGGDQRKLQSIVEEKGLVHLDDDELELLLYPNDAIYRYLAANELSSGRGAASDFNRQEFRDLFGEIPFRIGFNLDSNVFTDVIDLLVERRCTDVTELSAVETLTALLTIEDAETQLQEDLETLLGQDIKSFYEMVQGPVDKETVIKKGEFIADHIEQDQVASAYNTLLSAVSLQRLAGSEESPLQLLYQYHSTELREDDKAVISRLLAHMIDCNAFTEFNFEKTATFLEEQGPKVVLFLDGLPLTHDTSVNYLESKSRDERWEVGFGVAPTPSVTETFREGLNSSFNFTKLGGFIEDASNLAQIRINAFFGDREQELIELLNNDESVIIYDNGIDQSDRSRSDVRILADQYWTEIIDNFVNQFGQYADILIVSDHGLVQTFESQAVPIPSEAGKKNMGSDCRSCFVDEWNPEMDLGVDESAVSKVNINLPESRKECIMLNLSNPHVKFGSQTSDQWMHGGISVEEIIVPFVVRRRSV